MDFTPEIKEDKKTNQSNSPKSTSTVEPILANQKPGSSQANQSDEENEDELSDQIKTEGGECKFQNDHKINITFEPSKKRKFIAMFWADSNIKAVLRGIFAKGQGHTRSEFWVAFQ